MLIHTANLSFADIKMVSISMLTEQFVCAQSSTSEHFMTEIIFFFHLNTFHFYSDTSVRMGSEHRRNECLYLDTREKKIFLKKIEF